MLAAEIRNHDFSHPSLGKDSCSENTCGSFIRVSECTQSVLLFRKLLSLKSQKNILEFFFGKSKLSGFIRPLNQ